jgi:hypothetical protein
MAFFDLIFKKKLILPVGILALAILVVNVCLLKIKKPYVDLHKLNQLPIGRCNNQERCVISFSLYGSSEKYLVGALKNVYLSKLFYPKWILRFYHSQNVPNKTLDLLQAKGAELRLIQNLPLTTAMYWRFLVLDDLTVDYYLIRDCDGRFTNRERVAVEEWLNSSFKFHAMRDHPFHSIPMMGGMWGGSKFVFFKDIYKKLENITSFNYGDDQNFLSKYIYPFIKENLLVHDSFHCTEYKNSIPFPSKRMGNQHVGQAFDKNDNPLSIISEKAPLACRRKIEWEYG